MTTVAEYAAPPRTEAATASLEFPAARSAARPARNFTRECLRLWDAGEELIEAAVLIVCELATNAICHGCHGAAPPPADGGRERQPSSAITLKLMLQPDALVIEVRDGSAILPVPRMAGHGEDSGRGLLIIAALAESWAYGRDPDGGKWVQARVPRTKSPPPP